MQSKPIRAFDRGLAVLATLNRHGSATALALSRESGIPRATVYRLLQTLQDAGYVGRGTADDRYHLRLKVRGLSEGFQDEQWISAIAGPALAALTGRLAIDRNMVGREMPVLGSSAGLAYIAFAPAAHREALLDLLAASDNPNDGLARDRTQVGRLVAATRRRGYGLRQGGALWPHTGSIALPVRAGGRLLGCINTVWMARAVSALDGVRRCLSPLQETRDQIERQLANGSLSVD